MTGQLDILDAIAELEAAPDPASEPAKAAPEPAVTPTPPPPASPAADDWSARADEIRQRWASDVAAARARLDSPATDTPEDPR